jgi:hypothetical protein
VVVEPNPYEPPSNSSASQQSARPRSQSNGLLYLLFAAFVVIALVYALKL